jgi:hypothetical protein
LKEEIEIDKRAKIKRWVWEGHVKPVGVSLQNYDTYTFLYPSIQKVFRRIGKSIIG